MRDERVERLRVVLGQPEEVVFLVLADARGEFREPSLTERKVDVLPGGFEPVLDSAAPAPVKDTPADGDGVSTSDVTFSALPAVTVTY